jgi:hypothetical protein
VFEFDLPEGKEVLDLLLARGRGDVLDVNSVGRHDGLMLGVAVCR